MKKMIAIIIAAACGVLFINSCQQVEDIKQDTESVKEKPKPQEAAKPFKPVGKLELYPTIECIGVTYSDYPSGMTDDLLTVDWRIKGKTQWQAGPYLVANPVNKKLRASIFPLPKGRLIEVRVVSGDTVLIQKGVQLRPDKPDFGKPVRAIYVSTKGSDSHVGSEQKPLRTIGKAMSLATAGDEIVIAGGVYRESVKSFKTGKPGAFITIRGQEGEKPLISGGQLLTDAAKWEKIGELYRISVKKAIFASIDGKRIYVYPSVKALKEQYDPKHKNYFGSTSVEAIKNIYKAIPCAMAYEEKTQQMYFRIAKGVKPWTLGIEIAQEDAGILLKRASFTRITNLAFSHFNRAAVQLVNKSHNNVIDNCSVANIGAEGISIKALSYDNLIEHNVVVEREYGDWVWALRKATVHESSGIACWRSGGGNVIRYNKTDGTFNGVAACSRMASQIENEVNDTDIYGNTCINHGDDAIEPEGAGVNNRIFNNKVFNSFVAISLAPINVGPTYVYRNLFMPTNVCFKLQNHMSPGTVLIYHNTCITEKGDGIVNHNRRNGFVDKMIFRNNIIQAGRYIISGYYGNDYNHNIFYTSDSSRFIKAGKRNRHRLKTLDGLEDKLGKTAKFTNQKIGFEKDRKNDVFPTENADYLYDSAQLLRGFNDGFKGQKPDMGYREYR